MSEHSALFYVMLGIAIIIKLFNKAYLDSPAYPDYSRIPSSKIWQVDLVYLTTLLLIGFTVRPMDNDVAYVSYIGCALLLIAMSIDRFTLKRRFDLKRDEMLQSWKQYKKYTNIIIMSYVVIMSIQVHLIFSIL